MTYLSAPGIIKKGIYVNMNLVLQYTSEFFGIKMDDLISKCRKRDLSEARQFFMDYCCSIKKQHLRHVGEKLGNRNHATIIYGVRNINDLCYTSKFHRETRNQYHSFINMRLNEKH